MTPEQIRKMAQPVGTIPIADAKIRMSVYLEPPGIDPVEYAEKEKKYARCVQEQLIVVLCEIAAQLAEANEVESRRLEAMAKRDEMLCQALNRLTNTFSC